MIDGIEHIHEGTRYRIKDREKAQVFSAICRDPGISRNTIARQLGLRPAIVSRVVTELIEDHLVEEASARRGRKGRPEVELRAVAARLVAVSIHVVSQELRGSLVAVDGQIVAERRVVVSARTTEPEMLAEMSRIIRELEDAVPRYSSLVGIGFCLPGLIDDAGLVWKKSSRWPLLHDVDLHKLQLPSDLPVSLVKSVTADLVYLMVAKPELRTGSTLLVHWGYGIGASFAHEGKVAPFAHGGFGEIGHWKLAAVSDRTCICGDTGCLETEAALWALLPEIENRFGKLPADEEGFTEFARANPLHETDGVKMALDGMIQTLHNLYQVFYPDRILLYGPFTANSAIFASLKDGLLNSIRLFMLDSVQVENVEVALHGQTIGATRHFVWDALKDYLLARWE